MGETFLMCEPKYFDVDYVINPWMKGHINKVDQAHAHDEWRDFYNNLKRFSNIELIKPELNLPDLVFTANAGLILNQHVILSHFRNTQRQPEEFFFQRWFEKNNYKVSKLPDNIYFEGHGDAIFHCDKKLLWLGYGIRTELSIIDYLKEKINIPIKPLKLVNKNFYHLDTCFRPLLDGYVMYYPDAFSDKAKQSIEDEVPTEKRIIVTQKDAIHFACNSVLIKTDKVPSQKGIIFVNAMSNTLQTQLISLGYQIQIQPVTEFRKSGGANQCLTLKLAHE